MSAAIALYHCVGARSFRPLWMLEELGLAYRLIMLPFPPRAYRKDYFDINPLGTVPALVINGRTMTESVAMCEYLAAADPASPLHVDPADPAYCDYLNWLHHGEATLTFPQTLVLRYARFEAPEDRIPRVAADYARWFVARTRLLASRLESDAFVCCGRFTAADVSVGFALFLAEQLELIGSLAVPVQRYWNKLKLRPAFRRALSIERDEAFGQGISPTPAALTAQESPTEPS